MSQVSANIKLAKTLFALNLLFTQKENLNVPPLVLNCEF